MNADVIIRVSVIAYSEGPQALRLQQPNSRKCAGCCKAGRGRSASPSRDDEHRHLILGITCRGKIIPSGMNEAGHAWITFGKANFQEENI